MRPEETSVEIVRRALESGQRQLLVRDLLYAVVVASGVVAAGFAMAPVSTRSVTLLLALALGTIAVIVALRRQSRMMSQVALLIERRDPSLKNLIVTAEELIRHPGRSADWISRRISAAWGRFPISGSALACCAGRPGGSSSGDGDTPRGSIERYRAQVELATDCKYDGAWCASNRGAPRPPCVFETALLRADQPGSNRCARRYAGRPSSHRRSCSPRPRCPSSKCGA